MALSKRNQKPRSINTLDDHNNEKMTHSEFICRIYINKIINNALRNAYCLSLDKETNNFTFNIIKTQLSSILAQQFISIEFEDVETIEQHQTIPILFYNRQMTMLQNSWKEIIQPVIIIILI